MLGDLDHRREFFYQVAEFISSSPDTNHTVYFLSNKVPALQQIEVSQRLVKLGLPESEDSIEWSSEQNEEENFLRIERLSVQLLFKDPSFINGLKKLKFDLGLGGLSMAETLLFRELELQYIKLS